jgi:general secretion pathway protein K
MRCHPFNPVGMKLLPGGRIAARQGGAALIVALLVAALVAVLASAMASEFMRFYERSSNMLFTEQSYAYLRGAEELASVALQTDYDQDVDNQQQRDDLTEFWAQQSQPYPLDDGALLTADPLEDLQGRFNLNHLKERVSGNDTTKRFTPAQAQFIRLLQALDDLQLSEYEAMAITNAVSDWLDEDSETVGDGAEDDYYASMTPAYRAANAPMASASELRAVSGITPEIYNALIPLVTVWPQQPGPMNIHTAPATLLRTINSDGDFRPLSLGDAETLIDVRDNGGFQDKKEFLEHAVFVGKKSMADMNNLLAERSSYFLLRATVTLADKNTHLYSVLERKSRLVRPVMRASGSI